MNQRGQTKLSSSSVSTNDETLSSETDEQAETKTNSEGGDLKSLSVTTGEARYTKRYLGGVMLLVILFSLGVMTYHPGAVISGIGIILFILINITRKPKVIDSSDLRVTRDVTPTSPKPGDSVTITLSITNVSDKTFPDIRVIDNVPSELSVADGSPRGVNSLRSDETIELQYTVKSRRGTFSFTGFETRIRSIGGGMWRDISIEESPPSAVECRIQSESIPIEEQGANFIGALLGDKSGEGLEFDKTREYHHGDSPRRINWRDLAKRNELSTVVYREHQTTTITVVVDIRENTHIQTVGNSIPLPDLLLNTTYEIATALLQQNHNVGFTGIGISPESKHQTNDWVNVKHRMGTEQKHRILDVLNSVELNYSKDGQKTLQNNFDVSDFLHEQSVLKPNNNQYIIITPLFDETIHKLCSELYKRSVNATVIVPVLPITPTDSVKTTDEISHVDMYTSSKTNQPPNQPESKTLDSRDRESIETNSRKYMRVKQRKRIRELRNLGITVIEWPITETLTKTATRQTKHTDTTI